MTHKFIQHSDGILMSLFTIQIPGADKIVKNLSTEFRRNNLHAPE